VKKVKKVRYIIGIDEAGRGPLAGPVSIGAVCIPITFKKTFWKGVKNSKALSLKQREFWFTKIRAAQKAGKLSYAVALVGNKIIDEKGISYAIRLGMKRILKRLGVRPSQTQVLLDGSLYAPKEYTRQKTIIKGDEKEPVIALASITAKVTRDRKIVRLSSQYPKYNFEIHKGYGTKAHIQAIKRHGASALHRKSFLTKI
jgi:ribonuclease HII